MKLSPDTGALEEITAGQTFVNVPIKPYGAAVDAANR